MYSLGEPSWQLQQSTSSGLDALLYLRDALSLSALSTQTPPVFPTPVAPQRRQPSPPSDVDAVTSDTETAWNTWWRHHVAHDLLLEGVDLSSSEAAPPWARAYPPMPTPPLLGPGEQDHEVTTRMATLTQYLQVLATHLPQPPRFEGVHDRVLRRAAQQLMPEAEHWADQLQLKAAGLKTWEDETVTASPPDEGLSPTLAHLVAQEVALDLHVPVHRLRVRLVTIEGPAPWWQVWAPGAAVCTRSSLIDPESAYRFLRILFRSGLSG